MVDNDPLIFIRQSAKEIFPNGRVNGSVLMSNIAFGAAALGSGHVEICQSGSWWFAASETNWLERELPENLSVQELFTTAVRFPKLSPSSFRPEIYVGVFAKSIYLDLNGEILAVKSELPAPQLPHIGVVPPWCEYVLGCQVDSNS